MPQNAAHRTITDCNMMSKQDHLRRETKMIPVTQRCEMLAQQYVLSCYFPKQSHHQGASRRVWWLLRLLVFGKITGISLTKLQSLDRL